MNPMQAQACDAHLRSHRAKASFLCLQNPHLPTTVRARDLLVRLTVDEKISMLYMASLNKSEIVRFHGDLPNTAVPRLGVGMFQWMGGGKSHWVHGLLRLKCVEVTRPSCP
jgi:hypothetical protein